MNLIESRQIRVFISSTFQDMQDERNELMKKTFPVLRRKAAERDVTLTELDLRWGITPAESQSGKVVEICLREIENSEPFFIGIIGNRYGWIPSSEDLGESLRERFTQVNGYVERRLSVTEMEMQFGVLERPEDLHAFFFIKEQESDDVDEPAKLASLKEAARANGRYPVSTYSSPEDLAQQVEEAFTKLLDDLFPEGTLSELEKERVGQRAYLNSLCQNYIRTDTNFAAIDNWMSDWEKHQLVITGASGLGKSALVANWVKEKLSAGDGLSYKIIYHFVGNGGSLGSHGHVIKALCDEIRDRYGFAVDEKEDKTDEKALEELFNRVAAEGDKPLLIVLDAINQIIDVDNAKQLNWLPIPPKNVKILFTTLEDDRTMDVFRNRHYPVFTLQPLTKAQREAMVRGYLGLYSKKLQPNQIACIVTDKQCENTLVLKTLLDELVNFGIFEKLDEKIGTYLAAESIDDFYEILLTNYENDFGEPFVKHILSLIAVSRNGLSEEEILAITQETPLHWSQFFCAIRQHLIVKNGLISFAHSYIRKAVEDRYLDEMGDWNQRVKAILLIDLCRKEIVTYFKSLRSHRAMDELPYQYNKLDDYSNLHDFLLNLDILTYLYDGDESELGKYWKRLIEKGKYSLKDYLAEIERVEDDRRAFLLSVLSSFTRNTVVDPALSLLFIKEALSIVNDEEKRAELLNQLGLSHGILGNLKTALKYTEEALDIRRNLFGENHPAVAQSYNDVGVAYENIGDHQKALEYEERALAIRVSLFGESHPDVAISYNDVGLSLISLWELDKSLEYEKKALEIRRHFFGENHPDVASSYNNVGLSYMALVEYEKALEFEKRALEIRKNLFGENHPSVAESYNNIGFAYGKSFAPENRKEAMEFVMKALEIRRNLFGENHPEVGDSYNSIGLTYDNFGEYQKAVEYKEKALTIWRNNFGGDHRKVADLLSSISDTYLMSDDHQKELEYRKEALEIIRDLLGDSHPDVAVFSRGVASAYMELEDYPMALKYDPDAANYFDGMANLYKSEGSYEEELKFKEKALGLKCSLYGENSREVAQVINNIGATYGRLGDKQKELDYRLKALEISRGINDQDGIATYLNRVGLAYKADGQIEKARDYFRQAAEKYRELGDETQAQANIDEIENC